MILIDSLSYRYPNSSESALQNVSLEISAGEFMILAGPSGSGKSTLLRSINGLVPHFTGGEISGKVRVNDLEVIEVGPHVLSRVVGFVNQNPESQALLDHVEPEVAFALENAAIPAQEMRIRVEEVLELMDLTHLRDRPISSLSGGERQRVAIASVLALRPQVLLLDEPTSQLDPQSAEKVLLSLVRLNEDLGLTVVVVEHRLERVLRYGDRLVYLENGRIMVDDLVRDALLEVPQLPPLVQLARELDWRPLPLTVKEGRRFAAQTYSEQVNGCTSSDVQLKTDHEPPRLRAFDVHFAYNNSSVLRGVNLDVKGGEIVALMGRNGSGKSTFLKCIMGLLQQASGTIEIAGFSTQGSSVVEIARDTAYLPQNPDDLLFAESVSQELQITLDNHQMSDNGSIERLLQDINLESQRDSYPRDLSTGQRQRVALGSVTITRPKLLLLDEPTRGLDSGTKERLITILQRWAKNDMGILIVTHDVELVAKIAKRVLILSQGEIIASGSPNIVLSSSPLFAPQITRLFPDKDWLTPDDAIKCISR
ncbi:MAG: energy-coupling factor transporter ATPase [Candidatus Promineifilaceae bacterium]|nr:energy-coupling factor transporter ATPase [Candidatus Promineifilaceae bacterium]